MAISAIRREIGIIGEAVNALPEGVTGQRPEIAWRQIGAMRNFLTHEYFNIDAAVVEDVIANDLDPLNAAVKALLDKAKEACCPERKCLAKRVIGSSEQAVPLPIRVAVQQRLTPSNSKASRQQQQLF
ncbi:MAG: DUF86 domain-containing protein [Mycobacterium sp.]|nr:DUF86 domain-containing protein [Mycobacterium sp.]